MTDKLLCEGLGFYDKISVIGLLSESHLVEDFLMSEE